MPPSETKTKKEIVTTENAEECILSVINSQDNVYAKNQAIREWINESGRDNFLMAEEIIANEIKKQGRVDVQTIALLGEVWQSKEALIYPSSELMEAIDFISIEPTNLQNCLTVLSEINKPVVNVALHKIIDFMNAYLVGCQNDLDGKHTNQNAYFFENVRLLCDEEEKSKNYLVNSHLRDIHDTFYADELEKEGKISGGPGGASDKNIYIFKNLIQAYDNRIKLGINEGFNVFNPVLKIAPGYSAMYTDGKVARIFSEKNKNEQRKKREEDFVALNDPEDEYIYEEINERVIPSYRCPDDSYKLERLYTVSDFDKHLKQVGREFFYDLSRIDLQEVHPSVVAEIMVCNQNYLNKKIGQKNESPEIPENEYLSKLFLTGKVSEEQLYNYFYFTNLSVRKKVGDDFGIDIGELNFSTQRYFLDFLETRSVENVQELQKFVRKFGKNGMQTFLSCEFGLENGEKIIEMGNNKNLSEESAKAIFAKYGEIAENLEDLNLFVGEHFKKETSISQEKLYSIAEDLMLKGKNFLLHFSENLKNGENLDLQDVLKELEHFRTDIVFFTSIFKNFAKNNPEASFEDFKGLSLETMSSPEVKKYSERFFEIANENNQNENPIMQEIVRKGLKKGLENEKTVFDTLLKDEDPIALQRFDDEGEYYYYGSVNVDVKYHGSAIFEQMKKESLDRRAKEKPIKAHCNSANFVSSQYVESSGFVIDGTVLDGGVEEKDGRAIDNRLFTFSIERDDQKNGNYQYRQHVSTQQLKAMENQLREDLESGKESRKELVRNRKPFVVSFEENQRPTFFKLAEKLMRDYGYVISRYFFEGKTGGKFFAGFEQKL